MRTLVVAVGFLTLVADGPGVGAVSASEQADALAARVLGALGRPVGLAHLPRCKDAGQALALARAGKWTYVHGQGADPAAVAATALGPDAALACLLHHSGKAKLVAHDRSDGRELWALELPAAPVHNGLVVAADGRIVVALRDGRVVCAASPDRAPN
jgi:outer membrane protein assembly factor BamB